MGKVAQTLGLAPKISGSLKPQATEMPSVDPMSEAQKARKKLSERSSQGREGTRLSDAGTQSYSNGLVGE